MPTRKKLSLYTHKLLAQWHTWHILGVQPKTTQDNQTANRTAITNHMGRDSLKKEQKLDGIVQ